MSNFSKETEQRIFNHLVWFLWWKWRRNRKYGVAFTSKYNSCSDSSDEDNLEGELVDTYILLLIEFKEAWLVEEKQKKATSAILLEKDKLGSTIADLEKEVTSLKSKIENLPKYVHMLNNGSDMLDEILEVGEKYRNMKVIWCNYSSNY